MKKYKYLIVIALFFGLFPSQGNAEIGVRAESKVKVESSSESKIDLRKLDLQKRLFQENNKDERGEFMKAREAFMNASSETRNMLRNEFRGKFVARFEYAQKKLAEFQSRMDVKLEEEAKAGVDTTLAEAKLEESISFMAKIEADVSKLQSILNEKYSEEERAAKKEEVKKLVEDLKTNIKASHNALKESFKELRAAIKAKMEVETSVEINTSVN
ncbi:MAG: hypothetical protein R3B39_00315 [Candidatus Paceibacterota bacterium]